MRWCSRLHRIRLQLVQRNTHKTLSRGRFRYLRDILISRILLTIRDYHGVSTGDRSEQTDQTHGKDQVCETCLAIVRAPRHELDRHLSVLSCNYHFRELDKPWPASAITSQSSARPSIRFTKSALARSRAATASYSFFFSSNLFIAAALAPCGAKDAACDLRFGAMECRMLLSSGKYGWYRSDLHQD